MEVAPKSNLKKLSEIISMESEFGTLLKKCRITSRLTQQEVVKKLRSQGYEGKYSDSDVSKWEHGRTRPPSEVVEILEDIFGMAKGMLLKTAGYDAEAELRSQLGDAPVTRDVTQARQKHFEELREAAEVLSHRAEELLSAKDGPDFMVKGNILQGVVPWRWLEGGYSEAHWDPRDLSFFVTGKDKHGGAIDRYLAKCLLKHYKQSCGKPPFENWEELTDDTITQEIVENLQALSHAENLKVCPDCPGCKATMGQ